MRCLSVLLAVFALLVGSAGAAEPIDFNRDIRPILSNKCFQCHGPDPAERHGGGADGLRLDTFAGATADLGDYAAIVPGEPAASALLERVTADDEFTVMPPPEHGKPLSAEQIDRLRRWIAQGADYAPHWAYRPPVRPPVPEVQATAWPRTAIDNFVLARLEAASVSPAPPADALALLRRVHLDLTGLPPTPAAADAYLRDTAPDAYERLVDRLLADPSYGEHRARKWLDLARYADSTGYADDPPRTIWAYRDYVVRAFNDNVPFDRFTVEQLAGDLLPDPTPQQLVATAFHRNTQTNNEGGTNDEEFRNVAVVDRVNTTAAVWLGTTLACAQCHTHKFDPITQTEYFQFFAFFNNTADADRRDESPTLPLFTPNQRQQRDRWETELAALRTDLTTQTPDRIAAAAAWAAELPSDLEWQATVPQVVTQSGVAARVAGDGTVVVSSGGATDVYTLTVPLPAAPVTAIRLETLPTAADDPTNDAGPVGGAGYGGGNFVISRMTAAVRPAGSQPAAGRFVRIESPGTDKILSLAEVQVFDGTTNVARGGTATQSSVAFEGAAARAIDGETNGDYFAANSVTHTATEADPWWELDLGTVRPIDRITLWNRTDGSTAARLAGVRISVLDDTRQSVFTQTVAEPPMPSVTVPVSTARPVPLVAAVADFAQDGFPAAAVLTATPRPETGWAVAPQQSAPHSLTLTPSAPIAAAGELLVLTIEQTSQFTQHTLGRFRLVTTSQPQAADIVALPQSIQEIVRQPASHRTPPQVAALTGYFLENVAADLAATRTRIARLSKQLADLKPATTVPVLRELPIPERRTTQIQHRGSFMELGDAVTEGTPAALPPLPEGAPRNRLTLARWLVSGTHPLTARVAANRCWEEVFGVGIVRTAEDFGSQGELPSHPELLDWLATELVRLDWDQKAFLRLLVTSATYRQSAAADAALIAADPENRLLARGPRLRLPAEAIRDGALAAAGLLSHTMYGEPVRPPQPSLGLSAAFGGSTDWKTSTGASRYRRGLYTQWRRSNPYPSMMAFDAPNRDVCALRRTRTNTPLQALVTLNDPVYIEAAQALGRAMAAVSGSDAARATLGFRRCVARPPVAEETAALVGLFQDAQEKFATDPAAAKLFATEPLGPLPAESDAATLAAWTVVANILLNLDETLTKP